MSDRVRLATAQMKLAVLWLVFAAVIFLFILAQTVAGRYGTQWERAWGWFLPTVLPTLSLIVGGIVFGSKVPNAESSTVTRSVFRIAYGVSAFYLTAVFGTLLMQQLSKMTPLEFMAASNVWLSAIQGLVGLALGAFFTSKE